MKNWQARIEETEIQTFTLIFKDNFSVWTFMGLEKASCALRTLHIHWEHLWSYEKEENVWNAKNF